jgi:hypothetical protein
VLGQKLNADSCRIVNRELSKRLSDISFLNNNKKSEKQAQLNLVIEKIQKNELSYIGEIYLKQT